jgi:hypothetical protein
LNVEYLTGGESAGLLLTGLSGEKRLAGRPQEITDETLLRELVEMNFILEQNWGLIGWGLKHAKTIGDIRCAFNLITKFNSLHLDLLRREPTQRATAMNLRRLRRDLATARTNILEANGRKEGAREACERAFAVATSAENTRARTAVQRLRPALAREYEEVSAAFEACQAHVIESISKLNQKEAYFAQSQLLDFIHVGRSRFSPLSLAMAMAGLPHISARTSWGRCKSLKGRCRPGPALELFQAIERVFAQRIPTVSEALDQMKKLAQSGQRAKSKPCRVELGANWYFMERAIVSVYEEATPARREFPYRILAEYQQRVTTQSARDVVLAKVNQLTGKHDNRRLCPARF